MYRVILLKMYDSTLCHGDFLQYSEDLFGNKYSLGWALF